MTESALKTDIPLERLQTIGESSSSSLPGEQCLSPEPIGSQPLGDFQSGQPNQDPEENSPTSPTVSRTSSDIRSAPTAKSNGTRTGGQKHKSAPPASSKIKHVEGSIPGQRVKRRSTTLTTNTDFSEAFHETAVWDQKTILALDGGGIRGYSTLLIIRELMKAIETLETTSPPAGSRKADRPPDLNGHTMNPSETSPKLENGVIPEQASWKPPCWLPCHYFDYMAGTSTGGLIAIMLGRLRMNIDDCIKEYENFGGKVFGRCRYFHLRSPLFWPRDKYNHKVLEETIKEVVRNNVPKVDGFPGGMNYAFDENRCRVMVIAFQERKLDGVGLPYLFRTYDNLHKSEDADLQKLDLNPAQAHDIPIWQVARATAAAPTYFKPMVIDGLEYLDGGFGANNPCFEAYEEVKKMNNNAKRCVRCILSVGTGKNEGISRFKGDGIQRYLNYWNFLRKWCTNSEEIHKVMVKARSGLEEADAFEYCRLNVEEGLGRMKLDEWRTRRFFRTKGGARNNNKTLETIRKHTEKYLGGAKVQEEIKNYAKMLVEIRRERAESNPQRWERACFGAWYHCRVRGCPRGEKRYPQEKDMRKHLLHKHQELFSRSMDDNFEFDRDLELQLSKCKITVQ